MHIVHPKKQMLQDILKAQSQVLDNIWQLEAL